MNINISIKLFKQILTMPEDYRQILLYIIEAIETKDRDYNNKIQINRKDIINKFNIPKQTVYTILSDFVDFDLLHRSSNDTYSIVEDNIIENINNSIKSFSKQSIEKFIDTTATYNNYDYGKCKIKYLHFLDILKENIPCVTFESSRFATIVTMPIIEFVKKFHKTKETYEETNCLDI